MYKPLKKSFIIKVFVLGIVVGLIVSSISPKKYFFDTSFELVPKINFVKDNDFETVYNINYCHIFFTKLKKCFELNFYKSTFIANIKKYPNFRRIVENSNVFWNFRFSNFKTKKEAINFIKRYLKLQEEAIFSNQELKLFETQRQNNLKPEKVIL